MIPLSIPVTHARRHRGEAAGRAEAVAFALSAQAVRRLLPALRPVVPPPRAVLSWRLERLARSRAAERRARERRRRLAGAAAAATVVAALAGARAAASRR